MDIKDLVRGYISSRYTMQVASIEEHNKPWICTVYYVEDEQMNLYWASLPDRDHSNHIKEVENVAAAIVVQNDLDKKVIGIQIEAKASELTEEDEIRSAARLYAKKFDRSESWIEDISTSNTDHKMYRLAPTKVVLFDEVNFPEDSKKTISINS